MGTLTTSVCFAVTIYSIAFVPIGHVSSRQPDSFSADIETRECNITDDTSCGEGYCCVYKILFHRKVRRVTNIEQVCEPFRSEGDLCLMNPENFICGCQQGLTCLGKKKENFGHCHVMISSISNQP